MPRRSRLAIYFLYAWCRFTDDYIDEAENQSSVELKRRVETLRLWTRQAHQGQPPNIPAFKAFSRICHDYSIPIDYPLALLDGMEMDAVGHHYKNFDDLWHYCYGVAGSVGLMTCHIFGLRSELGLIQADALGRAMQLTNIARDIITDARLGRVYIPDSWFPGEPLSARQLLAIHNRKIVQDMSSRLLSYAEVCYREGEKGFIQLPWQVGFAVCAARWIYSAIGKSLKMRGIHAWDSRTWEPFHMKLGLLLKACLLSFKLIPSRIRHPWSATSIRKTQKSSDLSIIEEGSNLIVRHNLA